jgi:hypothetical protein
MEVAGQLYFTYQIQDILQLYKMVSNPVTTGDNRRLNKTTRKTGKRDRCVVETDFMIILILPAILHNLQELLLYVIIN